MTMFRQKMDEDLEFIENLYEAIFTLRELGLQKKFEREMRISERKLISSFREKFLLYSYAEGDVKCVWEYDRESRTYLPIDAERSAWMDVEGVEGRVKVKACIYDENEFERDYTGNDIPPRWTLRVNS